MQHKTPSTNNLIERETSNREHDALQQSEIRDLRLINAQKPWQQHIAYTHSGKNYAKCAAQNAESDMYSSTFNFPTRH